MTSKPPGRLLQSLTRRARPCWRCANSTRPAKSFKPDRQFSTTALRSEENDPIERPRWSYTPEQMKAPFHPRVKDPRKAWQVIEDPAKLDKMYIKFLGKGGDKILPDEVKWLAVTHKSFDQGRRGFNDRLAFFGELSVRSFQCILADE
jgi:large subunit ribosomal protein L15